MGRKKSDISEEITDVIDLEELEMELDEDPSDDGDDDSEVTDVLDEKTVELDLSDLKNPKEKKKESKAPAREKAKKESKKEKQEAAVEPTLEAEEASEEKPKRSRRKTKASKEELETGLPQAFEGSIKSMADHWKAVQENSEAFTQNVERATALLKELPASYDSMLDEMAQRYTPKTSKSMRIALCVSVVSLVFSGISLIFSQSVRMSVLDKPSAMSEVSSEAPAVAIRQQSDLSQFSKELTPAQKQNLNKFRRTRRR